MKRIFFILPIICLGLSVQSQTSEKLSIVKRSSNSHGLLCRLENKKRVIFLEGSPEEMGSAHGELLKPEIAGVRNIIMLVATGYLYKKNDWFFTRIDEVMQRTKPFIPDRIYRECDAMSKAAGITKADGRQINFFPEMFHCSGVAVRNTASKNGEVIHARVLDYMSKIGLQNYAVVMVFMPKGYNKWLSQSYAGIIGTVTAMNEKGLAMGEMGGGGVGKWDGLPMTFLMRRVMEECTTVDEALELMKKTPLTCDYYYVLSDKNKNMAGVVAISGKPLVILKPGAQNPQLPEVPEDTVLVSGKGRAEALSKRLKQNFGKIDAAKMIEIIKRPVAMKSNLHNAIFLPESQTMYFADASGRKLACDEKYYRVNLKELIKFYQKNH